MTCGRGIGAAADGPPGAVGTVSREGAERVLAVGVLDAVLATAGGVLPICEVLVVAVVPQPSASRTAAAGAAARGLAARRSREVVRPTRPSYVARRRPGRAWRFRARGRTSTISPA